MSTSASGAAPRPGEQAVTAQRCAAQLLCGDPACGAAEPPRLPPPLLLGAFDPLLLGWASRDPVTGPHKHIVTVNGLFRPFALADGRAVAT